MPFGVSPYSYPLGFLSTSPTCLKIVLSVNAVLLTQFQCAVIAFETLDWKST